MGEIKHAKPADLLRIVWIAGGGAVGVVNLIPDIEWKGRQLAFGDVTCCWLVVGLYQG